MADMTNARPTCKEMTWLVQEALDDPRVGDVFHEMYSYGVQVIAVSETHVGWRSFSTDEIARGWETREKWSKAFRYSDKYQPGDSMYGKHTMMLMTRGEDQHG